MDSDDEGGRKRPREADDAPPADGSGSDDDFDDGYGPDLMGDEEDRARLAAMTELDREMELGRRDEERQAAIERRRNARLAAGVRTGAARAAKKAAAAADRAAGRSKQPEAAARRAAAADLREARRAGAARAAGRGEGRAGSAEAADDYTTRRGAVEEEDDGYETGEDARPTSRAAVDRDARARRSGGYDDEGGDEDDEPASYAEAVAAQVRRAQLARWLGEPHAAESLVGTVVRLAFRGNYMAALVQEVVDRPPGTYRDPGAPVASPYTLTAGGVSREAPSKPVPAGVAPPPPTPAERTAAAAPVPGCAPRDRSIRTGSWLKIARGTDTRLFPASLISNSVLTEEEFESWGRHCARMGVEPWSRSAARAAAAQITSAAAYTFSAADVKRLVDAKRAAGGGPVNRAVERTRLATLHAAAVQERNDAEAARLAAALADLDAAGRERAAAAAAKGGGAKAGWRSLEEVNRRNAERNLATSLAGAGPTPGGGGGAGAGVDGGGEEGGGGGAGGGEAADPFRRRETRPRHMWATGGSRKAAAAEEAAAPAPAEPAEAEAEEDGADADPAAVYAPALAADLSRLATGPPPPPTFGDLARKLLGCGWAPPARQGGNGGGRTLTLDEYFAKRENLA